MNSKHSLHWSAGSVTPLKTYMTRVFNYGTWEEWQAMKRNFPLEAIQDALHHPLRGQWTRRGKAFAETLFDCRLPADVLISFDV